MPRPSKGARLWYDTTDGRWYVRDGRLKRSTGCAHGERERADQALAQYIATRHKPNWRDGDPAHVSIADVLLLYWRERAPHTERPIMAQQAVRDLGLFWRTRKVAEITPGTCAAYVKWRTGQPQSRYKNPKTAPRVGPASARRELETLSAAIGYAYRERKLRYLVPVALPQRSQPRDRWLTRSEVARFLWACWRSDEGRGKHLCRLILLGLYTGTRLTAMLRLRWIPSVDAGWVDLDRGLIYRKGSKEAQTKKRRTPVPISDRLMAHMRRWRRSSSTHVIEYYGQPITTEVRSAWNSARERAGLAQDVTPHCLRHSFASWAMQEGQPTSHIAQAMGTTEQVVISTYGHHDPARLREIVNAVGRRRG